ncbi:MAG: LacI family transcriptional [Actinobacteria bacterium]|nr:MAG: LacI family transcriptional [Actinomycetota bacterium]MDO8950794.1 LacI family DNA-binding transcriptional regulator [Actinomycetota bacterium]
MTATIRDVADRAGVSVATASRVLTASRKVSAELAARVNEAARSLGYRHNAVARALRRGTTNTVGMIVPEIGNPFFPAIVEAVERHLQGKGRDLFLCDAQQDIAIERHRVLALLGRQVDGLIIVPVSATASRASLEEAAQRTPVVQVDRYVEEYPADWVGVDDDLGIGLAVEHVASLGATNVVFVSALLESSSARQRHAGFERTMRRLGLPIGSQQLLGDFRAEWGRTAALQILARKPLPHAVVCGNDEIAVGVLGEFRRQQVRVPEDILVTGFDDIRFAALADPPLTTVRQPHEQLAAECIRLLDARMVDGDTPVQRIAIAPSLVVRESTGGHS